MTRGPWIWITVLGAGASALAPATSGWAGDTPAHRGAAPLRVHAEAPPLGHSGGFGEPTCLACHTGYPLNEPGGSLALEGRPDGFEPGGTYALTVVLAVPETVRAGFQLTARHPDGRQAGRWVPVDARAAVVDSSGVSYARSTLDGTEPHSPDVAAWTLTWMAPDSREPVWFHLAANSGNGDDSPFGDLVHAASWEVESAR
ncbi:MAG TPA: choice-of-anchor V domain-containing protein [Longimicrobiales bacterium]|nr:choice-of-anchor V domain-containing protein [Longimicrobiales bacterium]